MITLLRAYGLSLLAVFLLPTTLMANPLPVLKYGNVPYITGGIGIEEREYLASIMSQFNLQLEVALKSGEYISDADVRITDSQKQVKLQVRMNGPILLAKLSPGLYTFEIHHKNQVQKRQHKLNDEKLRRFVFQWKSQQPQDIVESKDLPVLPDPTPQINSEKKVLDELMTLSPPTTESTTAPIPSEKPTTTPVVTPEKPVVVLPPKAPEKTVAPAPAAPVTAAPATAAPATAAPATAAPATAAPATAAPATAAPAAPATAAPATAAPAAPVAGKGVPKTEGDQSAIKPQADSDKKATPSAPINETSSPSMTTPTPKTDQAAQVDKVVEDKKPATTETNKKENMPVPYWETLELPEEKAAKQSAAQAPNTSNVKNKEAVPITEIPAAAPPEVGATSEKKTEVAPKTEVPAEKKPEKTEEKEPSSQSSVIRI